VDHEEEVADVHDPTAWVDAKGFMNKIGLLNKVPRNWRELVFRRSTRRGAARPERCCD
jgi:hypothetical protein